VADSFEHGSELLSSIICGEFLDHLKSCELYKWDSAPWRQLLNGDLHVC